MSHPLDVMRDMRQVAGLSIIRAILSWTRGEQIFMYKSQLLSQTLLTSSTFLQNDGLNWHSKF